MTSRSWLFKLIFRTSQPQTSKRRHNDPRVNRTARPRLETLEDRLAPASFVVSDTSDNASDNGSLRYAVNNLATGGNSITFASTLAGQTITLTNGELAISQDVTITGPGANWLSISGNGNASRIFDITSGHVVIAGLTITDGGTTGSGNDPNQGEGGAMMSERIGKFS